MNTIERTQNEMSDVAAAEVVSLADSCDAAAKSAAKLRTLADWELAYVSGGNDAGCW
jgi:hypothetical protein